MSIFHEIAKNLTYSQFLKYNWNVLDHLLLPYSFMAGTCKEYTFFHFCQLWAVQAPPRSARKGAAAVTTEVVEYEELREAHVQIFHASRKSKRTRSCKFCISQLNLSWVCKWNANKTVLNVSITRKRLCVYKYIMCTWTQIIQHSTLKMSLRITKSRIPIR